ncbi:MAG: DegT/DnrJ/EryC1/StrS family aminotransferase [Patescibacteria group bacterium]|nr:DegT/DnrJ/EryC1/StrS family aminotransferase [Patescibacteria group bacterium]
MQNDNLKFKIPLIKPEIDAKKLKIAIDKIARNGILTKGKYLTTFEKKLSQFLGVKYAFAMSSCTTALHLSLIVLGVKAGDEVIVSDFSFPATGNVVVQIGAKPVFVDIEENSFNIDPEKIEEAITSKTKAIIVVHAFGLPAKMNKILKIAKKHKLFVIEDAACALDSAWQKKLCGTWGDVGCFSFHPRKTITTGEGGAVVTNNSKLAKHLEILRNHGGIKNVAGDLEFIENGFNYRLSELQAALGVEQMSKVRQITASRQRIAQMYFKKLSNIDGIRLTIPSKDYTTNFQSFVILLDKKIDREDLRKNLTKNKIESTLGTYAMHAQKAFQKFGYKPGDLPNSYFAYRHSLTLPLYGQMTEKDVDFVVENLKKCLSKYYV